MFIETLIDNETCRAQVKFGRELADTVTVTTASIKRLSSVDNFSTYELIANISPSALSTVADRYFYDYTIEPGIFYKYSLVINNVVEDTSEAKIALSTGTFLLGENGVQLNFIYGGTISDYKQIKKDSIIETLGSQFPFIIRANNIGYRQLSISGIAVSNIDTSKTLSGLTYSTLFGTSSAEVNTLYSNIKSNLESNANFILEKEFRKKLMQWMNAGKPMLFKSDTEGLILGRATEVSFSPKQETGRVIYDISFTFTELNSPEVLNLQNYGILKPSSYLYTVSDLVALTNGYIQGNF